MACVRVLRSVLPMFAAILVALALPLSPAAV